VSNDTVRAGGGLHPGEHDPVMTPPRCGNPSQLEHEFSLELSCELGVTLNLDEHGAYGWSAWDETIDKVAPWRNRRALEDFMANALR